MPDEIGTEQRNALTFNDMSRRRRKPSGSANPPASSSGFLSFLCGLAVTLTIFLSICAATAWAILPASVTAPVAREVRTLWTGKSASLNSTAADAETRKRTATPAPASPRKNAPEPEFVAPRAIAIDQGGRGKGSAQSTRPQNPIPGQSPVPIFQPVALKPRAATSSTATPSANPSGADIGVPTANPAANPGNSSGGAAGDSITIATLNCMWFFAADGSEDGELHGTDRPTTREIFERKAGHLIGLLPQQPPLLVALEEVGGRLSLETLAASAKKRYGRDYTSLFVQGKDTYTGQDVAALFDTSQGWKIVGQAARHGDLERELAKHLVLTLEKDGARLNICVAHLRVPKSGDTKRVSQVGALVRWVMRHNAKGDSNVIVLGDLNEGRAPGSPDQDIAPLLKIPMTDAVFDTQKRAVPTHAGGSALDRILVSEALKSGTEGLTLRDTGVIPHTYTRRNNSVDWMEYTDHFAVWASFTVRPKR